MGRLTLLETFNCLLFVFLVKVRGSDQRAENGVSRALFYPEIAWCTVNSMELQFVWGAVYRY